MSALKDVAESQRFDLAALEAHLAPARAGDAARFADGKIREVVMQDELLRGIAAGIGIELLDVFASAKCAKRDRLGLATLEER